LASYVFATVIYDLNQKFLSRWINPRSRNWDQMDQAGRLARRLRSTSRVQIVLERRVVSLGGSGKHPIEYLLAPMGYVHASQERVYGAGNIAEGYTMQSLESYIKLLGVATGSFKELSSDFEDFIRTKNFSTWDKEDKRVRVFRAFRAVWVAPNKPNTPKLPNDPEEAANMMLTFCQMETFLLDKQIKALREKFIKEGGFRENLFKQRLESKYKK